MTIASAIGDGNIIGMCIGFIIFSMITFAVLMMMDVMECFLHALRLHWYKYNKKGLSFKINFIKEMDMNSSLSNMRKIDHYS